ncbi:MAG: hypothetical protein QXG08_07955 [Candidatus Methanomethyliaceae archaeon]
MSEGKRRYEIVESKYLAEYIAKRFPNAQKVMFQVPVGDYPHTAASQLEGVTPEWFWRFGPRVDAIVIADGVMYVIEAETRRPVNGLSELELYNALIDRSPHLGPYLKFPRRIVLLTAVFDPNVAAICKTRGWDYEVYKPDWLDEHLRRWGVIP